MNQNKQKNCATFKISQYRYRHTTRSSTIHGGYSYCKYVETSSMYEKKLSKNYSSKKHHKIVLTATFLLLTFTFIRKYLADNQH
jgi:hypothetical protein